MARIRTIKPELWSSERFGECSTSARLMFVASLNFADDAGNLDRSARQLKAQTLPHDHVEGEPLVAELLRAGLFIEYKVSDKFYLHIKNFDIHQKIDRPSKSRLPLYDPSVRTRLQLGEPSTSPRQKNLAEGKGREGKVMDPEVKTREAQSKIPSGLDLSAWETWEAYRTKIRKPLRPVSIPSAQKALAKFGVEQSAVVEQSIAQGWTGFFPLKHINGSERPYTPARSTAEILAEEEREQQSARGV